MITARINPFSRPRVKRTVPAGAPLPAGGFSRLELMVAVLVAWMLAVVILIGAIRGQSLRTRCQSNLRQIAGALQNYAKDNHDLLPDCSAANPAFAGRTWPWDLNTNTVAELERRHVSRDLLYCPANPAMNESHQWNFCYYDTTHATRILGYCFLLNGIQGMPEQFRCTNLKGSYGRSPAETELVTDAVVCVTGDARVRDPLLSAMGDDYANSKGVWKGRTSHLTGLINGVRPAGGNIAFEDGHVAWRNFDKMQHRLTTGNIVWDF